jgi:hypothetical protein
MLAGGKIPSIDNPHHTHQELTEILMSRFLKAIKRREVKAQTLLSFSQEAAGPRTIDAGETPGEEKRPGS